MSQNKVNVKNLIKYLENIHLDLNKNLFDPDKDILKQCSEKYMEEFEKISGIGINKDTVKLSDDGILEFDAFVKPPYKKM